MTKLIFCVKITNTMDVLQMQIALSIVQIIVSIALVIILLMQSGKNQGLPGSIAGGAETFFGKNKLIRGMRCLTYKFIFQILLC